MEKHGKNLSERKGQSAHRQRRNKPEDWIQVAGPERTSSINLQRAVANPAVAAPHDILSLQHRFGNRAVSGLIQTKLTVGAVGDYYEQEADRVAERVLSMPSVDSSRHAVGGQLQALSRDAGTAQRQEEEDELQAKPLATTITPLVQRQEEDEELMMKPVAGQQAVQRQEEDEELMMKPVAGQQAVQRQEEDEELMMKPVAGQQAQAVQRQEEDEELMMKPADGQQAVQRQEEDEELMMKPVAGQQEPADGEQVLQRQEEDEELMMKPVAGQQEPAVGQQEPVAGHHAVQRQEQAGGSFQASSSLERQLSATRGGGNPLSSDVRSYMEPRFGADFSQVRVHTDSDAVQMTRDLKAQAFTRGQDIYFRPDRYEPGSEGGKRLLAHELTHVIQQSGGGNQIQQSGGGNQIQRWGGPGNTTSHETVTEDAFAMLTPKLRMWYSDEAQTYLKHMSEQMDMRAGFWVTCGYGKIKQWLHSVAGAGMYNKKRSWWKRKKKITPAMMEEEKLRRARAYDNMIGYWRSSGEAPNHAEGGMYKADNGAAMDRARVDSYLEKAVDAYKEGNPRQALSILALGLHTAEDRGAHGDGKPGTGHDPRRLIEPPPGATTDFYDPGWSGSDCDLKDKNPTGYVFGVAMAARLLSRFVKGIGVDSSQETGPESMRAGGKLAGFTAGNKLTRGWRKFRMFLGKDAIRP